MNEEKGIKRDATWEKKKGKGNNKVRTCTWCIDLLNIVTKSKLNMN